MSWKIIPLGRIYRRSEESGRPDLQLLSVYRDHGVLLRDGRADNYNRPGEDLSSYKVVERGDLVLNKMKTWQGSLGVSAHRGIVSPAYFIGRRVADVEDRFMHHLLRSQPLVAQYGARSKGIRPSQWDLPWEEFASIKVAIPGKARQQAIADFLDTETTRIDALIAKKRRMIDVLVESQRRRVSHLLGCEVAFVDGAAGPSGTVVIALRRVAEIRGGLTLGKRYDVPVVEMPYLRVANVQDSWCNLAEVARVAVSASDWHRFALRAGDVLVLEGNGNPENLGRGAVWRGQIDPCLHQNHVHAVRTNGRKLQPEYLALILRTDWARHFFTSGSAQVSIATLSQSRLGELPIPLPGVAEQEALIARATSIASVTSRASAALGKQIDLLREHRQALITAAVTGELDVPVVAA